MTPFDGVLQRACKGGPLCTQHNLHLTVLLMKCCVFKILKPTLNVQSDSLRAKVFM